MPAIFPSPQRSLTGFTLVEVVIAIGIFAFAIIGIFGLMMAALDTARLSSSDTVLSAMTTEARSELQSTPFTNLWNSFQGGKKATSYYYEDGQRVPTSQAGSGVPKNALFRCVISGTFDSSAYTNTLTSFVGTMDFHWPADSPGTNGNNLSIPFKIARYEQ